MREAPGGPGSVECVLVQAGRGASFLTSCRGVLGMKRIVLILTSMISAALLAITVSLVATGNTAQAAFPGTNGKIAFTRDPDGY